jgi:glyceraldehyde 3-phosphate dehydrogenase
MTNIFRCICLHNKSSYEKRSFALQTNCRKSAVEFIKIVNDLWYDDAIELVIFRNQLIDKNVNEILRLHDYASAFVNKPISIFDAVEVAKSHPKPTPPAIKD